MSYSDVEFAFECTNSEAAELMRSISTFEETEYCWRTALGSSDKLGTNNNVYAIGSAAKG